MPLSRAQGAIGFIGWRGFVGCERPLRAGPCGAQAPIKALSGSVRCAKENGPLLGAKSSDEVIRRPLIRGRRSHSRSGGPAGGINVAVHN